MKIKIFLLFTVMAVSVFGQAKKLNNFEELMYALKNGGTVKAVIYYGKCDLIIDGEKEEESPDAIGGMEISTYEYFAKGVVRNEQPYVTASETVLISHPFYGYVYNYGKLRVYEDNSVEIIVRYLSPNDFVEKMDETFKTTINDDSNEGAIEFFVSY